MKDIKCHGFSLLSHAYVSCTVIFPSTTKYLQRWGTHSLPRHSKTEKDSRTRLNSIGDHR